jgi:hypothetical protein
VGRGLGDLLLFSLTATVSVGELLWTLPALVAWLRYGYWGWRGVQSQRALARERPAPRLSLKVRVRIRARRYLALGFIGECMAVVGLGAMLQPPTLAAALEQPAAVLAPLILTCVPWTLILIGELVERDERAMAALYAAEVAASARTEAAKPRPPPDVRGYMFRGPS